MTVITNICPKTRIDGIKNAAATLIICAKPVAGSDYVVSIGSAAGGDFRVGFGDKNKQWDGKPMQAHATGDPTLYIRALNAADTVTVTGVTVCTLEDWQRLQALGLSFFDGDTMPLV